MRLRHIAVLAAALLVSAASPPFNLDVTHPGDNDIQSVFPANERTFRDNTNSYLNTEHDIATGYHAFQELTTTNKNALVNPPKGMVVYDTTLAAFQINTGTAGSPIWTTIGPSSGNVTGPGSSTVNDIVLWNNSGGSVLKDGGYTMPTSLAAHQIFVATGTTTVVAKTIPDCQDTTGKHLNYTQSTDAYSCGTTTGTVTGTLTAGTANTLNPLATSANSTQAHGLGQKPDIVNCYIENITGELGYSAGDRVMSFVDNHTGAANQGLNARADATNTYILTGSVNTVEIIRADTNISTVVTNANWKAVCTPYKIN